MMCGSTPTHTFTLPFNVDIIKNVRVVYSQGDEPLFVKEMDDCVLKDYIMSVKLTQEDTLSFDYKKLARIQVRVLTINDDSLVSTIKTITPGRCLEKEVIE